MVFEGGELLGGGFEQKQSFCRGLDLPLPVVDRLDGGDESGAGSESLFDEGAGQAGRLAGAGTGGEDEADWRGGVGHWVGFRATRKNKCKSNRRSFDSAQDDRFVGVKSIQYGAALSYPMYPMTRVRD